MIKSGMKATTRVAAWLVAGSAVAHADSLTVEVSGVRDAAGQVLVSLCGDANGQFPGGCNAHSGRVEAVAGTVTVRIEGLPAGRYALQAFHDANGNDRPDIPPEGYAFGNDVAFPPSFSTAAVEVRGEAHTSIRMQYAGASDAPQAGVQGSPGADPPAGVQRRALREQGLPATLPALEPDASAYRPDAPLVGLFLPRFADGVAHPAMGRTPVANRAAWQDSWQKTLQFLRAGL